MSPKRTGVTPAVLQALQDFGRMSSGDIIEETGYSEKSVRDALYRLAGNLDTQKRVIRIASWRKAGIFWQAVYELGDKPDAKKPPPMTKMEMQRQYRQRRGARLVASSVFRLAASPWSLGAQGPVKRKAESANDTQQEAA